MNDDDYAPDEMDLSRWDRQDREYDSKEEAEAKRRAAGYSPEQLSMQDAFIEGQRAGNFGHGASMNPYQSGSAEHTEWERARSSTIGARLNSQRRSA